MKFFNLPYSIWRQPLFLPQVMVGQAARNNLHQARVVIWFVSPSALILKPNNHMFRALSGALTLALTIIVLNLFLPEIAAGLIELTVKIVNILIVSVDQASANLPH